MSLMSRSIASLASLYFFFMGLNFCWQNAPLVRMTLLIRVPFAIFILNYNSKRTSIAKTTTTIQQQQQWHS